MDEKAFESAYYNYQRRLWENLIEAKDNDLTKDDDLLYSLLRHTTRKSPFLIQAKVDHHPDIAPLVRKLDDFSNYADDEKARRRQTARDTLRLMRKRDAAAKKHDFHSYKDLIFTLDGFKEDLIKTTLAVMLRKIGPEKDRLIRKKGITYDNFYEKIRTIGLKPRTRDPEKIIAKIKKKLGYENFDENLMISIDENHIAGYTAKISKTEIRLAGRPIDSVFQLKTFLHELSHVILKHYQKEDGLEQFLRPARFEMLSVIIEYALIDIVCTKTERMAMRKIATLELSRSAISALFEFDLHDDRKEPEKLFKSLVGQVFDVESPAVWSLDTFRSVDAMTIHYYALGYLAAENLKLIRKMEKVPADALGTWLMDNIITRAKEIELGTLL